MEKSVDVLRSQNQFHDIITNFHVKIQPNEIQINGSTI